MASLHGLSSFIFGAQYSRCLDISLFPDALILIYARSAVEADAVSNSSSYFAAATHLLSTGPSTLYSRGQPNSTNLGNRDISGTTESNGPNFAESCSDLRKRSKNAPPKFFPRVLRNCQYFGPFERCFGGEHSPPEGAERA